MVSKPAWLPGFSNYDELNSWKVLNTDEPIEISIASYKAQHQGKELIYYSNKINGVGDKLHRLNKMSISERLNVNQGVITNRSGKRLVYWYFKVGNLETGNRYIAKLLQIPADLQALSIASLVTISLKCRSQDCTEEAQLLSADDIRNIMESIQIVKRSQP
jgi:hypothetical protein